MKSIFVRLQTAIGVLCATLAVVTAPPAKAQQIEQARQLVIPANRFQIEDGPDQRAERDVDEGPLSESHPEIYKQLVDFQVARLSKASKARLSQLSTRWSAAGLLPQEDKAGLLKASEQAMASLDKKIAADVGQFLDRMCSPNNPVWVESGGEEVLESMLESLESGEEDVFFYRLPAELRLENHQPWIDLLQELLPGEEIEKVRGQATTALETRDKAAEEFLEEWLDAERSRISGNIDDQLTTLFDDIDPEPETKEAVRRRSEKILDDALADWSGELRYFMERTDPDIWEFLTDLAVGSAKISWKDSLADILDEDQQKAWVQMLQRRNDEELQRFEARLDTMAANYRNYFQSTMDNELKKVLTLIELDEPQEKQFRAAADEAVDQTVEDWKNRARKWIDSLEGEDRENALRRGHISVGVDRSKVANQAAWKKSFDSILTEEQRREWTAIREFLEEKKIAVAAKTVLFTVDEGVGLTPAQWEQMEALIREQDLSRMIERLIQPHFHINTHDIGRILRGVDGKSVRKILKGDQWERWSQYVGLVENPHPSQQIAFAEIINDDDGSKASIDDPIEREQIISSLIQQRSILERDRVLMELMADIDFIRMTADLPPHIIQRLETAAKGAAEEVVDEWSENFSRTVRGRVQQARSQNLRNQLASLAGLRFVHREPTESSVWKQFDSRLKETGQDAVVVPAIRKREELRWKAIAELVTLHTALKLGLDPESWTAMNEAVLASLLKYSPDFESALGRSSTAWYFRNPGILMPVAAIPEKRLREILTQRQYQRWRDEVGTSTTGFWSRVKNLHKQRTERD